ncbi:hypothetical protein Q8A67_010621 [Cirrhinus molitorella]|uniref:Uncharacterized protein n=1 Tax=Cirrhinus molitorella TaxID=172907 RepID=A0AA88PU66_9TELE|nr:hypothetical protein Q8A67_010621 [Cirrhinus molitorella]
MWEEKLKKKLNPESFMALTFQRKRPQSLSRASSVSSFIRNSWFLLPRGRSRLCWWSERRHKPLRRWQRNAALPPGTRVSSGTLIKVLAHIQMLKSVAPSGSSMQAFGTQSRSRSGGVYDGCVLLTGDTRSDALERMCRVEVDIVAAEG